MSLGRVERSYLGTGVGRAKREEGGMQLLHSVASVKGVSENFKKKE